MVLVPAFLILLFSLNGLAMIVGVPAMRARAQHLGLSYRAYRVVGTVQVLGGVGLALGLWRYPLVGLAAAAGFAVMMLCAAVLHRRAGDPAARLVPALAVMALSLATLLVLGVE